MPVMQMTSLTSLCNRKGDLFLLIAPMWPHRKLHWISSTTHRSRTQPIIWLCSLLLFSLVYLLSFMLQAHLHILEHLEAFHKCRLISIFWSIFTKRQEHLSSTRLEWFALSALDLKDDGSAGQMGTCLLKLTQGMMFFLPCRVKFSYHFLRNL